MPTSPVTLRRVVELAVAASSEPLSIETLLGWNVARPAELWTVLSTMQADGSVTQAEGAHFTMPAARVDEVVRNASAQEWDELVSQPDRIVWAVAASEAAAATRRFVVMTALLRALASSSRRDAFPGGERGWLATVLQALRVARTMVGLPRTTLERAASVAVAQGDIGAQGVLHGSLAAAALRDGRRAAASAHLEQAREAARACTGAIRAEIHLYLAVGLALQGRPREAVDTFEELLGDVPDDVASLIQTASSAPATPLFVMTISYASAGQTPRALELVDRIRAVGAERHLTALEREADLFAGLAHAMTRDHERAARHLERAHAFYAETNTEPVHLWFASAALAWARAVQGKLDEIESILAGGLQARRVCGWPWLAGSCVLDLLERLDVEGIRIDGFELDSELDRILSGTNVFWRGLAHRYRARALRRKGGDARSVARHLRAGIALLRDSGAGDDLARALQELEAMPGQDARPPAVPVVECDVRTRADDGLADAGRAARLSPLLIELGRLGSLAHRREGTWGEIAARLCRVLSAERCAVVERTDPPSLLAVRGGSEAWRASVLSVLKACSPERSQALPTPAVDGDGSPGQLLVVPFSAGARAGWVCLENRHASPAITADDGELLEILSVQLSVVLGNVALWQELSSARERLEEENRYWRSTRPATSTGSAIVGDSPALRRVLELVARVAPGTTPVLVTGETGVGKELIAAEVHRQSARRKAPFIAVHVASLSPGLVASGLFGHERGAFTGATEQAKGRFELADGGTLFLDEIGELSPEEQVRLLRVLQQGTFERVGGTRPIKSDFRLIAATNRSLEAEVRTGRFREDLYFRLAGFPIHVPPLRERREEIPTLALFFLERASRGRGVRFDGIREVDMERLLAYGWPGNVRELEHVIERAVILSDPPRLEIPPLEGAARARSGPNPEPRRSQWVTLAESERAYITQVLRATRGRITGVGGAAEILGLKPSTLNFRIRKLGLTEHLRQARQGPRSIASR